MAAWHADSSIMTAYSQDNGDTWSDAQTIFENIPADFRLLPDAIQYVGPGQWSIIGNNQVTMSTDGKTWSAPEPIRVDTRNLQLPLLVPIAGNETGMLMCALHDADVIGNPDLNTSVTVLRSVDGGATWAEIAQLPTNAVQNLVHSGGSNWVAVSNESAEVFLSEDDGASWTSAGIPASLSPPSFRRLVSDHNGTLVSVASITTNSEASVYTSRTYVSTSTDNGQNWTPGQLLFSHTETVTEPGLITFRSTPYVLFLGADQWKIFNETTLSDDFSLRSLRVVMSTSFDGAATWGPPVEVGDIGTANTASAGVIITAWEMCCQTIAGQHLGTDTDILSKVMAPTAPPTAARDWEKYF